MDQTLVTRRGSPLATRAAAEGVTVVATAWGPSFDLRATWRVLTLVRSARPHILHAHDSHALAVALAARSLAGRPRPAVVATRRVDFPVSRRGPWHRADHVIAISQAVADVLRAGGIPATRLTIVPSGVDAVEVRRDAERPLDIRGRLGLAPGTPIAANVAALVGHKDHATLIRAAAEARPLRPDLHWVIAGEGDLRPDLEQAIATAGLRDRVHLLGYIDAADALIKEATVLVMSSRKEGLGSVVLHGLALGTPVVATSAGGLPEMLPPEAVVPVGDAARLAAAVVRAVTHPPSAVPLPARFTAAAMAAGVLACYRTLT